MLIGPVFNPSIYYLWSFTGIFTEVKKKTDQEMHTIIYVSEDPKKVTLNKEDFMERPYKLEQFSHQGVHDFVEKLDPAIKSDLGTGDQVMAIKTRLNEFISSMKTSCTCCIILKHGSNVVVTSSKIPDECITKNGDLDAEKLYNLLVKPHELYVIVGRADELESELNNDIRVACKKAGFDDERTVEIMKRCNCSEDKCVEIEERSEDTLLRIIMLPTVEEFETFMKKAIYHCWCNLSLIIIYCGHGTEAGNICLFDDDYSGAQLNDLLSSEFTKHLHYPTDVTFYFNCCYAVNVVAKMTGENVLQKLIDLVPMILNGGADEVIKAYYGDQKANEYIQSALIERLRGRTFFYVTLENKSRMYLSPLSVGVLKAKGLIATLLGILKPEGLIEVAPCKKRFLLTDLKVILSLGIFVACICLKIDRKVVIIMILLIGIIYFAEATPEKCTITRSQSFRLPWYHNDAKTLSSFFPFKKLSTIPHNSAPKITVFGAKNGDSALFSWKKWNILIDGGLDYTIKKPPCFVDKIKTLNKLDLVVLTHGDGDHVNGLLPFFKKMANDKKNNKNEQHRFVEKAAFLHHKMKMRGWSRACELYKYAKEAGIECLGRKKRGEVCIETLTLVDGKNKLTVQFIHPPPGSCLLTAALEKLKDAATRGTLTLINQTSLVVYIECQVGGKCTHRFLFTGDADGTDVITALTNHGLHDKEFSYVDMPHHGSKINHPEEFLRTIKAKNIGVSTNGQKDGHPNVETLDKIYQYMKKKKKCHIYFNYMNTVTKIQKKKVRKLIQTKRIHIPTPKEPPGFVVEF